MDEIARCHDFARAMFTLSEATCGAQDAYIAEVSEQLGIAEGATPPETGLVARASKKRGRRKPARNRAAIEIVVTDAIAVLEIIAVLVARDIEQHAASDHLCARFVDAVFLRAGGINEPRVVTVPHVFAVKNMP